MKVGQRVDRRTDQQRDRHHKLDDPDPRLGDQRGTEQAAEQHRNDAADKKDGIDHDSEEDKEDDRLRHGRKAVADEHRLGDQPVGDQLAELEPGRGRRE